LVFHSTRGRAIKNKTKQNLKNNTVTTAIIVKAIYTPKRASKQTVGHIIKYLTGQVWETGNVGF
jgi:hypothetical protein